MSKYRQRLKRQQLLINFGMPLLGCKPIYAHKCSRRSNQGDERYAIGLIKKTKAALKEVRLKGAVWRGSNAEQVGG